MESSVLKEQVDALQKDIVQLTEVVKAKVADNGISAEVKELADKVSAVQAELKEKKHQFDVGTKLDISKKDLDTRMDELVIARALCTKQDGTLDHGAYDRIAKMPTYADAVKAFGDVYATDSTTAGSAAEFVTPGFSPTLLEEIWLALQVGALFKRINMPNPTYTLPFLPGRIIAKAGSEGGTVNKTKVKSSKIVFTAQKIMSIVEMTDEFEQDSIVPALNLLRTQLIDGFALAQETMCLNGDNTTDNALLYGAALATDDCRKLVKGIRADAMDSAGANAKKDLATGGITADNLRALRVFMGKYGKKPSDLAYIMSMADYLKCLDSTAFPNYQTLYTYGANAQILTGELGRVDNIPIIVTELLPGAGVATDAADVLGGLNASGKFDGTTYTKGTVVLVNKNAYQWGDRSDFTLRLWLNPLNGTTNLIGNTRLDFEKVTAKANPTCSVGYNF